MNDKNHGQLIALQRLITDSEVMALVAACEADLGKLPENAHQWVQTLRIFRKQNILKRDISLPEMQKAISCAQEIVDESMEQDIGIISCFDEDFPEPLKHIVKNGKSASPLILYYRGNMKNVSTLEAIAIIGTRNPSGDGLKMGEFYGHYFAGEGFNIV
ncbi:MAG: DNA-protecting protein DprA, partial [Prevotellaceae bacterium]|nr:DNA-protecting protein DprA [Prevotellaceae bacterium]